MKKIFLFVTLILIGNNLMASGWDKNNYEIINNFIQREKPLKSGRAVVAFDWDNTVIHNDIGDYFFQWMLDRGYFKYQNFKEISPYITEKAVMEFEKKCKNKDGFINSRNQKCNKFLSEVYYKAVLPDGIKVFSGYDPDIFEPSYALLAEMMAGYSVEEMKNLCEKAVTDAIREKTLYIYPEMQWLINNLKENGFEVWVISASPQLLVETFAKLAGIENNKVIGVRTEIKNGIIQNSLQGAGPFKENTLITYRLGKRCWINEVIFKITGKEAVYPSENINNRTVFAAGDSDTDYHFLIDATKLRLLINRQKPEVTKAALKNEDGKWIVNEPFGK